MFLKGSIGVGIVERTWKHCNCFNLETSYSLYEARIHHKSKYLDIILIDHRFVASMTLRQEKNLDIVFHVQSTGVSI